MKECRIDLRNEYITRPLNYNAWTSESTISSSGESKISVPHKKNSWESRQENVTLWRIINVSHSLHARWQANSNSGVHFQFNMISLDTMQPKYRPAWATVTLLVTKLRDCQSGLQSEVVVAGGLWVLLWVSTSSARMRCGLYKDHLF